MSQETYLKSLTPPQRENYLRDNAASAMAAKKFLVEVCIDNSEHSVIFWFESVELKEIQDATVDAIFADQMELFKDFVVVNK